MINQCLKRETECIKSNSENAVRKINRYGTNDWGRMNIDKPTIALFVYAIYLKNAVKRMKVAIG